MAFLEAELCFVEGGDKLWIKKVCCQCKFKTSRKRISDSANMRQLWAEIHVQIVKPTSRLGIRWQERGQSDRWLKRNSTRNSGNAIVDARLWLKWMAVRSWNGRW